MNTPEFREILTSINARVLDHTLSTEQAYLEFQDTYVREMRASVTGAIGRLVKTFVYVWLRDSGETIDQPNRTEQHEEALLMVDACLSGDEIVYDADGPDIDRISTLISQAALKTLGLV